MNEKILLTIAFIGSLFGLLMLYVMSNFTDFELRDISEVNSKTVNGNIKVGVVVVESHTFGNTTFIRAMQAEYIDIALFNTNSSFDSGDMIEVIGSQQKYEGKNELMDQE